MGSEGGTTVRVALANLPFPPDAEGSVEAVSSALEEAADAGAQVAAFPECFVPGYRLATTKVDPPDPPFLRRAWTRIAEAAKHARIHAVVGTERRMGNGLRASALVVDSRGRIQGFQDKVQLDPSEESTYAPGRGRRLFQAGPLRFGVAICHEGWRYPETVRWAARRGAHVVFHPQFHAATPGAYRPRTYGDPRNTFHEKAVLCRAAENECYFATVNYASPGSPTTSAVAGPDGSLLTYQPYGRSGLLLADLDLARATGGLARRLRPLPNEPPRS